MPSFRPLIFIVVLATFVSSTRFANAQTDLRVATSVMRITSADISYSAVEDIDFFRTNVAIDLGWSWGTLGLIYQNANKAEGVEEGRVENGLMLTGGYDYLFSHSLRLEGFARVGVSNGNDESQPLYATDTDVRVNLVAFSSEGTGFIRDAAVFPSGYVGAVVNKHGRVQALAGGGVWWHQWSAYVTAFHAFNGVSDPMNAGGDFDRRFAFLKNRGITTSFGYDVGPVRFGVQRNFGLLNSGNDLAFTFEWKHLLGGGLWE